MKVIGDDNRRHVAFSKRKAGIINKAAELSVLTGSEVVVIVFSKYGKTYTFSTPGGPAVLSSVRNGVVPILRRPTAPAESDCGGAVRELRRLEDLAERRKREKDGGFWWDRPVTEAEDAEGFLAALKDLRRMVAEKAATEAAEEEEEEGTFEGWIDGDGNANGLIMGSSPSSVIYN